MSTSAKIRASFKGRCMLASKDFDLVTGGAGFIGSHLCEALLASGRNVRIVDDFSTGRMENLNPLLSDFRDRLDVVKLDIRDRAGLSRRMRGVGRVFHLAAMTSVEESVQKPDKINDINVNGTLSVLMAAREAGVEKLVFASSTAVYGNSAELPKAEHMPAGPASPYAVTKLAGELYCKIFSEIYGLPTLSLRFFNVFGPRQDPRSPYAAVIPRFMERILTGFPPIIYGDGEQTRDFVFVKDVARANLAAASSEASGLSLNVASGNSYSLLELVEVLGKIHGGAIDPVYENGRSGEVRHSAASIELIRETIGFSPTVNLEEGLTRTLSWFSGRLNA